MSLHPLDRFIGFFSPSAAVKRTQARNVLAFYEAAKPDGRRFFSRDRRGPNSLADQGAVALRTQMRHLERNHDITAGVLRTLVNNAVGPTGIGVEFQPRRADGSIHTEYANQLATQYRDWCRRPEVTGLHHFPKCQRLAANTWFRDGEAFAQRIKGPVPLLDHGTAVPYSLELLEPDLLPYEFNDVGRRVRQSIETNTWGAPAAYWVYKSHPGELMSLPTTQDMKRIPADRMLHLAERNRIGQMRGITRFASVINRIGDIKDYEDSERIAAKIASRMTAYVKRHAPEGEGYIPNTDKDGNLIPRKLQLEAGTIIDTLAVGEEIGLINSNRPNPNLVSFRNGQLRALAAGVSASFSSISRSYDGTYSAQRQEMVEQWVHYACMTDDFTGMFMVPVINDFIQVAHLSGVVRRPDDVVPGTEDDVLYIAPNMPWIDPAKEALAMLVLVQAGFASEVEMIRRRGQVPDHLLEQVKEWRRKVKDAGLSFNSDAAMTAAHTAASMQDGAKSSTS